MSAIMIPLFVQITLVFVLLAMTGSRRIAAVQKGLVKEKDIALATDAYPDRIRQISNCMDNQFQMPVLFYALIAILLATGTQGLVYLVLAWIFVLSRLIHAYIFVTTNILPHRFGAFIVGVLALFVMWIVFAFSALT